MGSPAEVMAGRQRLRHILPQGCPAIPGGPAHDATYRGPSCLASVLVAVATPQFKGCDGLQDPGEPGEPQGRKALVRERAEYFRLMDQGFSSREAIGPTART